MEYVFYFIIITILISGVIGSFFSMTGRALISLSLTFIIPITQLWYIDLTIYVWLFLIFTSDIGIVAIISFLFMYKREVKKE